MEEAATARRVARESVQDISPARLRDAIDAQLASTSTVPGVLTLLSARAVAGPATVDVAEDAAAIERRAAGVQLIYEGLRLTRTLVDEAPWTADTPPNAPADLDILAADVLVARGFRLLAHTDATDAAVETVREFGRERTDAHADRESTARTLEANVFDLAAVAGATAVANETPVGLRRYAVGLAHAHPGPSLAAAEELLPETVEEVMGRVSHSSVDGDAKLRSAESANRND